MQDLQTDEVFSKGSVTIGRRERIISTIQDLSQRLKPHEVVEHLGKLENFSDQEVFYALYEYGRMRQAAEGGAAQRPVIAPAGEKSLEIPVEEAQRLGFRYGKHQVLVASFDAEEGVIMFTGWGRDPLNAEKVEGAIVAMQMYLHDQGLIASVEPPLAEASPVDEQGKPIMNIAQVSE